jgi:hypothetical protein
MSSYLDEIPDGIALNSTVFETISQAGRIDGSTERYRTKYEFDTSSESAYEAAWVAYPSAWDVYVGTSGATSSIIPFSGNTEIEGELVSNPVALLRAISFYIYTEGEDTLFAEAQREELKFRVLSSTDGTPLVDDGRIRSMEKYITERGSGTGTYENPDAFYNPEVYDNVVSSDGFLPRVVLDGSQTLADKYAGQPVLDVLTTNEKARTEYENVTKGAESEYGWGSSYATGGKLAREI